MLLFDLLLFNLLLFNLYLFNLLLFNLHLFGLLLYNLLLSKLLCCWLLCVVAEHLLLLIMSRSPPAQISSSSVCDSSRFAHQLSAALLVTEACQHCKAHDGQLRLECLCTMHLGHIRLARYLVTWRFLYGRFTMTY